MIRVYITSLGDLQINEDDVLTAISVSEFRDNGIERRAYYNVSNKPFDGAEELKKVSRSIVVPDSYNYTLNGELDRKNITLCTEKLELYFKEIPESIYFKGTRW